MLPFGVTIPATVSQRPEIPEGIMNYPVLMNYPVWRFKCAVAVANCVKFLRLPSLRPFHVSMHKSGSSAMMHFFNTKKSLISSIMFARLCCDFTRTLNCVFKTISPHIDIPCSTKHRENQIVFRVVKKFYVVLIETKHTFPLTRPPSLYLHRSTKILLNVILQSRVYSSLPSGLSE
jgi:hypothetical protein